MSTPNVLAAALDDLADLLAERIAHRLLANDRPGWIDQSQSPLGPRRHRAAVRRRLSVGEEGASRVGRRHLLSADALAAELQAAGKRTVARSLADDLRRQLKVVAPNR